VARGTTRTRPPDVAGRPQRPPDVEAAHSPARGQSTWTRRRAGQPRARGTGRRRGAAPGRRRLPRPLQRGRQAYVGAEQPRRCCGALVPRPARGPAQGRGRATATPGVGGPRRAPRSSHYRAHHCRPPRGPAQRAAQPPRRATRARARPSVVRLLPRGGAVAAGTLAAEPVPGTATTWARGHLGGPGLSVHDVAHMHARL
jgi:hypothetical protein